MYRRVTLALLTATIAACSDDGARSGGPAPVVVAVAPANGASGVSPTAPVVVTFSHSMKQGMELAVVLHEGSITGPVVAGSATWSSDRTTLTFVPAAPLAPATTYVLHLAPAMMSESGATLDHSACTSLGGTMVAGGMMGGGMGGGMRGGTMGDGTMGPGAGMMNGSYGMSFVFTTA